MARKTKFTPETVARITKALRLGATHELAAHAAGIDGATFYRWLESKREFCDAVKKAEGVGALRWLVKIEKAANEGDWQAAAWKLERRYPDMYGQPKVRHEVTGKNGGSIEFRFFDAHALSAELAPGSVVDSRHIANPE